MKALEVAKRFLVEEEFEIINEMQYSIKFIYNEREYIIRCLPTRLSDYVFYLHADNIYPITQKNFNAAIKVANEINVEFSTKCTVDQLNYSCSLVNSVVIDKYEFCTLLYQMERARDKFTEQMKFDDMISDYAWELLSC